MSAEKDTTTTTTEAPDTTTTTTEVHEARVGERSLPETRESDGLAHDPVLGQEGQSHDERLDSARRDAVANSKGDQDLND